MERLNPPPAPKGRVHGVSDRHTQLQQAEQKSANLHPRSLLTPPIIPPGGLRIPPVGSQKARSGRLESDANFDHFLDSIFCRFGLVLGRQVGVIFGTFGAQVRPSCVQNSSWKLMNVKNVNFHETLRLSMFQRFLEPQDASQNASRSAQDSSKRLLKIIFFALENRIKCCLVLGSFLVDFGASKRAQNDVKNLPAHLPNRV